MLPESQADYGAMFERRRVGNVYPAASHSCGALDLQNGTNNDSYRIGDWFQETMADYIGCQPSSTHSTSPAIPTGLD
jgi:hypothetical protein